LARDDNGLLQLSTKRGSGFVSSLLPPNTPPSQAREGYSRAGRWVGSPSTDMSLNGPVSTRVYSVHVCLPCVAPRSCDTFYDLILSCRVEMKLLRQHEAPDYMPQYCMLLKSFLHGARRIRLIDTRFDCAGHFTHVHRFTVFNPKGHQRPQNKLLTSSDRNVLMSGLLRRTKGIIQ
jgi:hypothetical protein